MLEDHQWWAIQGHNVGAKQAKDLFLNELTMLSIVITLIMGSAFSKIFVNYNDEQVFGNIDETGKRFLATIDHTIFFICLMDLTFTIIIFGQLNIRVSGASVMHFFEESGTAWYPSYLITMTQLVIALQCVSVCAWGFCNYPWYASVLLTVMYVVGAIVLYRVFSKLDGSITLELSRLATKMQDPAYMDLHRALRDAGVEDFAHDVAAQVQTELNRCNSRDAGSQANL